MYSESDIDAAVAAGAIPRDTAVALRDYVAARNAAPAVDEEHFRLLTGFNDIFVAIAVALVLVAVGWIGRSVATPLAGALVAASAWGLAEYFTRVRRMALPSILLLLAFVGGVASTLVGVLVDLQPDLSDQAEATISAGIAAITAGAAWLHWRRFMVPITVAAGAVALVAMIAALAVAAAPGLRDVIFPVLLVCGVGVFALAMAWDVTDRERRTRRSDVAFWLHLAAAPMIAHSTFHLLGVFGDDMGVAKAAVVIALYLVFAFVALAVDRRALLVSSLAYVLYAMYALMQTAGAVELAWAFTALAIGSALLTLSAFWSTMRRAVVSALGSLAERLPPVAAAV